MREPSEKNDCPACFDTRTVATGLSADERYELLACQRCATQFYVDHVVGGGDHESHYSWESYKLGVYGDEQVRQAFEKRYKGMLDDAESMVGRIDSVLDIGCGIGNFVEFAQGLGLRALGSDISPQAVAEARKRGLTVSRPADIPALVPDESVAALTLWDVIEHVMTPREFLDGVVPKVKHGGAVLFETPDAAFPVRRLLLWLNRVTRGRIDLTGPMYYLEHKIYFTEQGLRALLDAVGVDILKVERRTSVREKMQREFAGRQSKKGRALRYGWPVLETIFRRAGRGNKLLVVARRR